MSFQQDREEVTYEEYEFVPMAPMDNTSIPEEMKEFMSMCCMMGMMPMNNLMNPMQRNFSLAGIIPFMERVNEGKESQDICKDDKVLSENNTNIRMNNSHSQQDRHIPNYGEFYHFKGEDEDEYHDNYSRIDKIVEKVERNNSEVFRFLQGKDIPYERAKKLIRRIVRLSLMYLE